MATKQNKLFAVRVKGIVCLPNRIAEIDTDTHYVYFVRRILSYVAFCMFYDFFNMASLSFFLHFLHFSISFMSASHLQLRFAQLGTTLEQ